MRINVTVIFVSIVLFLSAVPRILNYQGKLTDTSGVGLSGSYDMTFRLYTSETGGEPLWTQTIEDVLVSQGLFSVELTGFPDSVDFSEQYWLEVEIDGERFGPRERLVSAPYAIRSEYANRALRSVSSTERPTERTGRLILTPGPGATLEDRGDSIVIMIGAEGGPGGVPSLSSVLAVGNNADGRQIKGLADPTEEQDAATKRYVDSVSGTPGVERVFRFVPQYPQAALYPSDTANAKVYMYSDYDPVTRRNFYCLEGLVGTGQSFNISVIWNAPSAVSRIDSLLFVFQTSSNDPGISAIIMRIENSTGSVLFLSPPAASLSWTTLRATGLAFSPGEKLIITLTLRANASAWARAGEIVIYY